jgi:hypothetical protein
MSLTICMNNVQHHKPQIKYVCHNTSESVSVPENGDIQCCDQTIKQCSVLPDVETQDHAEHNQGQSLIQMQLLQLHNSNKQLEFPTNLLNLEFAGEVEPFNRPGGIETSHIAGCEPVSKPLCN